MMVVMAVMVAGLHVVPKLSGDTGNCQIVIGSGRPYPLG